MASKQFFNLSRTRDECLKPSMREKVNSNLPFISDTEAVVSSMAFLRLTPTSNNVSGRFDLELEADMMRHACDSEVLKNVLFLKADDVLKVQTTLFNRWLFSSVPGRFLQLFQSFQFLFTSPGALGSKQKEKLDVVVNSKLYILECLKEIGVNVYS